MYQIHATLPLLYLGRLNEAAERAEEAIRSLSGRTTVSGNAYSYDPRVFILAPTARLLWLQGFPEMARRAVRMNPWNSLWKARHSTTICFVLAMAGCPIKLWNGQFAAAGRHIALLQEYARAANSPYWQNYVAVFRSGLPIADLYPSRVTRAFMNTQSAWDPRHWENISVLGQGFAPPHLLERAKSDRCWWCTPEILRLEAMRLIVEARPGGDIQGRRST